MTAHSNVVYFTIDSNFLPFALATASALADEVSRNFDIVILLDGMMDPALRVPPGVEIIANELDSNIPSGIDTKPFWGRIIFTRIFAPTTFSGKYRKALYLDADVAALGPVSSLLNLDMQGAPLAAVEGMMDEGQAGHDFDLKTFKQDLGIEDDRYFNSGVLLIDVDQFNRTDHVAELTKFSRRPHLRYPDQDYLNSVFAGRWLGLSPRWNFQTFLLNLALEPLIDPVLVHYVGPRRPWNDLLFPFDERHIRFYREHLARVGANDGQLPRPFAHRRRHLVDCFRAIYRNHLSDRYRRDNFRNWMSLRHAFKDGIASRLREGRYVDINQGLGSISLEPDDYSDLQVEDIVYRRRHIVPARMVS